MTITLEQIEEMKIPVGTPIELTIPSLQNNSNRILGYFKRIEEHRGKRGKKEFSLVYEQNDGYRSAEFMCLIPLVEKIKILQYKK